MQNLKKSHSITDVQIHLHINSYGGDIFGAFARSEKIVNSFEKFFNKEIYHYHSKLIWKLPGDGAFNWHQDYGYWYKKIVSGRHRAICSHAVQNKRRMV